MNCLMNLPRFSTLPQQSSDSHHHREIFSYSLGLAKRADRHLSMTIKASSGSNKISETYSTNMTEAMGAVLTYKHERGMNYNHICSDLIVGSCLQTPADVDKLRAIGVKTIFCLQQDPDLEYFGVDIGAIQRYAESFDDIEHIRAEIRDFDAHDLRIRLPSVVGILYKAMERNGGVTYIHCTAGMGRAPGVALAYMFWVMGYQLNEAYSLVTTKRDCFPKVEAIKAATADILTGLQTVRVCLTWEHNNCSLVEIAGLDVGWGGRLPLRFDDSRRIWVLERELLEGRYEYKYIVNGDWMCDNQKPMTKANKDGNVNNYIDVVDKEGNERASIRRRMFEDGVDLSPEERLQIKNALLSYPDD